MLHKVCQRPFIDILISGNDDLCTAALPGGDKPRSYKDELRRGTAILKNRLTARSPSSMPV